MDAKPNINYARRTAVIEDGNTNRSNMLPPNYRDKTKLESAIEREDRLRVELKRDPSSSGIFSIPYEYVGNEIRHLYRKDGTFKENRLNYPDWHKITPAYKLAFSGLTTREHLKSFVTPSSGNFIGSRAKRWWDEDKTVIYSGAFTKISVVATAIVLLMTLIITFWQLKVGAQMVFEVPDTADASASKRATTLTNINNSKAWNITKLFFTAIPTVIMVVNIYKRTTLPKTNVQILDFEKGIARHDNSNTMGTLRRKNKHQSTMHGIAAAD